MITCSRRLEFDAGHRLLNHESRCRNLHGHRYSAVIEATAEELDEVGRVVDFSVIKTGVGAWIDEHWDHGVILEKDDLEVIECCERIDSKCYVVPFPPTAEHLALYLFERASGLLFDHGVRVVSVTLWETPNCHATYRPDVET